MDACEVCGNPLHDSSSHAVLEALNMQTRALEQLAQITQPPIYRMPAQQVLANANGLATIIFPAFPGGVDKMWAIEKTFAYTNSTQTNINVGIYVMEGLPLGASLTNPNTLTTQLDPLTQVDASTFPIVAADDQSRIYVKGGEILAFQWNGLAANDKCVARFQYKLSWQGP